jgi:Ni/Co efflux regulator RcnB
MERKMKEQELKRLNSHAQQLTLKASTYANYRQNWDGYGGIIEAYGLLYDPELREGMGISEEQYQSIRNSQMEVITIDGEPQWVYATPEIERLAKEIGSFQPSDPYLEKADDATKMKYYDLNVQMMLLKAQAQANNLNEQFTPEQKRRMQEFLLATMSERAFFTPYMFEALDLTEAQKQEMDEIKKPLEPDAEKFLEELMNLQALVRSRVNSEMERQGVDVSDPRSHLTHMQAITNTLAAEPEFIRLRKELEGKAELFATQFKTKMFDVLTDEQWMRLQNLIDNPPDYIKAFRKKLKQFRDELEKKGVWTPGPGSWQPGDPIPEQYRQERNTRRNFPRKE